jgi:rhodanese-related sulfurtransferase
VVHGNGKAHQSPGKRIVVVGGSAAGPKVAARARRLHLSCRDPLHATQRKIDAGETPVILDARGPDEYEQMRLGIGEHLIPLGALRGRLNELPADKEAEIICFCKISLRGYEAARALMGRGWTNVKVMEGAIDLTIPSRKVGLAPDTGSGREWRIELECR